MRSCDPYIQRAAVEVSGYCWVSAILIVLSSVIAAQTRGPVALSFQGAVQLALENNFSLRIARERINESKGRATQLRAGLLPNLSSAVAQTDQTINLSAQGFQPNLLPGGSIPILVGPFSSFDARVRLVQTIFNLQAIRQFQSGRAEVEIARLEEQLVRQQVITQTALAYLNAISTSRAVEAARANIELARSLLQLAQDQHDAGVATGLDVTRAGTRLAEEEARLAQAQTNANQARLALLRTIGLPLSRDVALLDPLQFVVEVLPSAESGVAEAHRERFEVRLAEEQIRLSKYNLEAARAEQLPSLDFVGDYGESANTPVQNAVPTRTAGLRLNIPIFNGGQTRGRIAEARSLERQAELQLEDTRQQVEEDVRLALQNVGTAAEQVRATRQSVVLAERELQMARNRFSAGVANNLEVVNAQTALANARLAEINALAQYNAARINLAAARGRVESFRW